jgi:hypothetical protein
MSSDVLVRSKNLSTRYWTASSKPINTGFYRVNTTLELIVKKR